MVAIGQTGRVEGDRVRRGVGGADYISICLELDGGNGRSAAGRGGGGREITFEMVLPFAGLVIFTVGGATTLFTITVMLALPL